MKTKQLSQAALAAMAALLCAPHAVPSVAAAGPVSSKEPAENAAASQTITSYPTDKLVKVPLTRQATEYTCGVSALQSVLAYYGDEVREDRLAKACKSNYANGTRFSRMAQLAKSKGYSVEIKTDNSLDDLQALLDKKWPVICLIQAWHGSDIDYANDWDDGHYVVAIGYDNDNVYFMDPSTIGNYTFIPKKEFLDRWHDRETKKKVLKHFTMVLTKSKPSYDPVTIKKLG
jgi:predicted double-glycine peptidase